MRARWSPVVGAAALMAVYLFVIRPRTMTLGATPAEAGRRLAGDDVVSDAGFEATRAITIHATPEQIWPWLVQMGSGRAGWYALDRLDNGGVASADVIRSELQDLHVGDLVPMVVGREIGPRVRDMERARHMLWTTGDEFSWEWILEPIDASTTRLINRIRERYPPLLSRRMLYAIVASSGDFVMNWKQLCGIRQRAEHLAALGASPAAGAAQQH